MVSTIERLHCSTLITLYLLLLLFIVQIVGFIWGYLCEDFAQTVYIIGAGLVLAGIVSIVVNNFLIGSVVLLMIPIH